MKTASTAFLAVLVISSLGIWGTAQQKNSYQTKKIHDLENRYEKLEEDYRSLAASNDATRRKLGQLELQRTELNQQVEELKVVVQERDELKVKLAARTNERDAIHSQLLQFSKDLQNFATRVETAAASPGSDSAFVAIPASRKTN